MNKVSLGSFYEKVAIKYLKSLKYKILEKNFKTKHGEIDIIAYDKKNDCLVFVEVRYRKNSFFGTPQETVNINKQRKIILSAMWYLKLNSKNFKEFRFDIISFTDGSNPEHIKDAFQLNLLQKYYI
ncbi:MAG: YraN family protein [Endomicrobiia bacterium]